MTEKDIKIEDEETLNETPLEETDNQAENSENSEESENAENAEDRRSNRIDHPIRFHPHVPEEQEHGNTCTYRQECIDIGHQHIVVRLFNSFADKGAGNHGKSRHQNK